MVDQQGEEVNLYCQGRVWFQSTSIDSIDCVFIGLEWWVSITIVIIA